MEFLGLHYAIWIVLALYLAGMLALGWWSKRGMSNQESYLMGNRRFGVSMMVMHSFGAGTHPGDVAGVTSKVVSGGASGIWVSWMWMFGTPFYWIIAPVVRRMRCLTLADFFQERFGKPAALLYVIVATVGMTVSVAGVLLATTRTVQGMMGKAEVVAAVSAPAVPGAPPVEPSGPTGGDSTWAVSARESRMWFYGILFVSTVVFMVYSFWGGIVAAIRTDMAQGLMIIVLSFLAIPAAMKLKEVGGLEGMRATVGAIGATPGAYLSLFNPAGFSLATVLVLCLNAPLSMLAQPHLMTVCGAGKSEWEGRVGFTYGNILKRVCTMGWAVLGLCWLAYLVNTGGAVHPDAAFGDSVRALLPPVLQGVMLACVMAAAMSTGDAVQVTVAGLFTQNIYRVYLNPNASEQRLVQVNRIAGLVIILSALLAAMLLGNVVQAILIFATVTGLVGISTAMGILWRRMNAVGMYCSTIGATAALIYTKYADSFPAAVQYGAPIVVGVLAGIVGSLLATAPDPARIDPFFKRIYTPIGQESRLDLPLDQVVPPEKRWLTAGGLFIVKPSRQSWVGFLVVVAICLACILGMMALLAR